MRPASASVVKSGSQIDALFVAETIPGFKADAKNFPVFRPVCLFFIALLFSIVLPRVGLRYLFFAAKSSRRDSIHSHLVKAQLDALYKYSLKVLLMLQIKEK